MYKIGAAVPLSIPGVMENHDSPKQEAASAQGSTVKESLMPEMDIPLVSLSLMFGMDDIPSVPKGLQAVAQPKALVPPSIDFSLLGVAATAPTASKMPLGILPPKQVPAAPRGHQRKRSTSLPCMFDFDEPELNEQPTKPHTSPIPKM